MVCILQGSVIFFADLLRNLELNCSVDFIAVSSYAGGRSTGRLRFRKAMRERPAGKHLLIVEDIVDTGATLRGICGKLQRQRVASVRTCALLDKPLARKVPVAIDYRGFTIPDVFVVGYGLDYRHKYRGLPYIAALGKSRT